MIYHLTKRNYRVSLSEDSTEDDATRACIEIEKWEVNKILNSGDVEIETLIKNN